MPLSRGLLSDRRCSGMISAGTFLTSIRFALVSRFSAERREEESTTFFNMYVLLSRKSLN